MPAKHHSSAPPTPPTPPTPDPGDTVVGRIPVLDVRPVVHGGRRPAKAVTGESFEISATVFREGHDAVAANVVLRDPRAARARGPPCGNSPGHRPLGATVTAGEPGLWTYHVEAWSDPVGTWRHHAGVKIPAGIDTELVLEEGARLYERAAADVPRREDRRALLSAVEALRDETRPAASRLAAALTPEVDAVLARHPLRDLVTASAPLPLLVERERALYGSWYEFFPRSEGTPNAPTAPSAPPPAACRPSPPWASTSSTSPDPPHRHHPPQRPQQHPHRRPRRRRRPLGHRLPEGATTPSTPTWAPSTTSTGSSPRPTPTAWRSPSTSPSSAPRPPLGRQTPRLVPPPARRHHRPRREPPKKYQDIYPIAFDADMDGLVTETCRILRHWMAHGVRIFRVDNPHTKPVVFWEQVIADINRTDPDVIFLAEAFTRPAMMHTLAAIGFQQSYTYFTWRNTKQELTEYLTELTGEAASYMRPNFFANTPTSSTPTSSTAAGPPSRSAPSSPPPSPPPGASTAATNCARTPLARRQRGIPRLGEVPAHPRDWDAAEREHRTIAPLITRLNTIRRRTRRSGSCAICTSTTPTRTR
ncbi:alpha-1,4-glucan--maltose-1-phosphate maltosyltransferase [Streptomyces sp. SW4]|nr:alpha-1,4-glucan--maltose-1-phosphate maltosyltransferase [Streptomyces sp. SW4]